MTATQNGVTQFRQCAARSGVIASFLAIFFLLTNSPVVARADARAQNSKPPETSASAAKKKEEGLPLQPDRTIEFTTDEGTWLSLDISPDGKTIVFELLGRLYTLPITGGDAQAITSGMEFDSQPKFSPDGKLIAFISDRDGAENVWVANVDGTHPRQLSKDKQSTFTTPAWLPDSQYVMVSRQTQLPISTDELWLYHVRGGTGFAIVKGKDKPDTPPEKWQAAVGAVASPDGHYLYYAQRKGFFDKIYNVMFPLAQIVRRDRITGDEDVITNAPGSAFRPLLSPDGNKLVYGTRLETETALRIRDLKTGEEHWLKYPVQRDDQESLFTRDFLPGYAFTPDGKEIVLSYGGKIHRLNVESGADQLVPFSAHVSRQLGPLLDFPERVDDGPTVKARLIQGPMQSPDGKRLAFSVLTHIYVQNIPGTPRRLTSSRDREYQPAWSPDGQWIAYVTWSTPEGGHIWKMRADGSGAPQRLTRTAAYYRDVVWSTDGTRIVALRGSRQWQIEKPADGPEDDSPLLDLVWIPSGGGEANLILPARGAGSPHFVVNQPDRVYVYTKEGLISMRYDGTDRRTHLKVLGKRWFPDPASKDEGAPADDVRISPDGQWALALVSSQLYLIAAPQIGGEPPTVDVTQAVVPPEEKKPETSDDKSASAPSDEDKAEAEGGATLPVKKLTDIGADYFAWADGGKTITWAIGSSFFREPLSDISFEPVKQAPGAPSGKPPDKSVSTAAAKYPQEIAVDLEFPRAKPKGSVVLRGAKVITMRGDEVLENADILVTDNRIAKVGARESFAIPANAKVVDVAGTIVPGFVDTHPHWTEIRRSVLDLQNWSFFANLSYGVTAGRDPQTDTNDTFAYQDLVDMGEIPGPRAFSTGPGIFPTNNFQSVDEVRSVVSRYKKYYRTHTVKSYMVGNRKQREWMVQACREEHVMPTTEGALDLKLDSTHIIDGFSGNEHSVPITPLYNDVVQLFAKSKVSYTPTLIVAYGGPWMENYFFENTEVHDDAKVRRFLPHNIVDMRTKRRPAWFRKDEHVFPRLAAQDKKIIEAGGRVCIGSHGEFQGLGYHWEMWALASGGMSNMEVLRSATLHGAEAIGYADDLGSIEPGKMADLLVLAKDPLADIHNTNTIRYVMKNGEMFEADTLNKVWPEQKPFPKMWWWEPAP
ncbi:MAG TPA: amidohydrolase family protein [Terriglobales bacterium]|nr:amidohydrolase family protein [Terriglobales bacterium]